MTVESVEEQFCVHTLTGLPSFDEVSRLEEEMRAEAGLVVIGDRTPSRPSPTTSHIAIDNVGRPLGVATSTVGRFAELPIGLALTAAGVDVQADMDLRQPACELVSISADESGPEAAAGVTEALFRSVYRRAKEVGAGSIVVGVDPWLHDVLRERYGADFTPLAPTYTLLGRELLAIGGDIDVLEESVARHAPAFAAYLTLPYGVQSAV